jgi:outer membrane lipoprotein carrier protein
VRRLAAALLATALVAASVSSPAHAASKPGTKKAAKPTKAAAPSSRVDRVVQRLQERYDSTPDFTADFTQAVEVPTLGKTLTSRGRVLFKRPGRMRWEFVEPEKQTIVADGKELWVYQPDHRQVLKAPFRGAFQSSTPVSFLLGVGKLSEEFQASLLPDDPKGAIRVKLVPKQSAEIGTLVLTVEPKTYDLVAAEVTDPLGNITRLTFSNLKRGVGVDDEQFVFRVPPGVDVVEAPRNAEP